MFNEGAIQAEHEMCHNTSDKQFPVRDPAGQFPVQTSIRKTSRDASNDYFHYLLTHKYQLHS